MYEATRLTCEIATIFGWRDIKIRYIQHSRTEQISGCVPVHSNLYQYSALTRYSMPDYHKDETSLLEELKRFHDRFNFKFVRGDKWKVEIYAKDEWFFPLAESVHESLAYATCVAFTDAIKGEQKSEHQTNLENGISTG